MDKSRQRSHRPLPLSYVRHCCYTAVYSLSLDFGGCCAFKKLKELLPPRKSLARGFTELHVDRWMAFLNKGRRWDKAGICHFSMYVRHPCCPPPARTDGLRSNTCLRMSCNWLHLRGRLNKHRWRGAVPPPSPPDLEQPACGFSGCHKPLRTGTSIYCTGCNLRCVWHTDATYVLPATKRSTLTRGVERS